MVDADDLVAEQPDFDPASEPESSKPWLNLIAEAEKAMQTWQEKSDNIDKLYASLEKQAAGTRDREFNIFWANIQVLGPSIYSRPPVPVVVPRWRSRNPVARVASEMLERCSIITFELEDVDGTMRLVRDDLVRLARGAPWVEYEDKLKKGKKNERVCIKHVDRRDFVCSPARKWKEVDIAAKREWLTEEQMKERFEEYSGDAYKGAEYKVADREQKDRGNADPIKKAGVWEVWSKSQDKVVWVTEGVEEILDGGEPYLTLDNFFPCPRPAYATVQPGSLVPVPDMVYYKDQLEEINDLTARIGGLADALVVKGFYPAGGEIGDVIEAALKTNDSKAIMVPVSNWAAFGTSGGDPIVWLPLEMIANTLKGLVELRKQLIDDVYQITGLSDIMRGTTNANETLGAQELKSQYGSVRVRDRQDELVRVARDLTRISAEVMAENFNKQTLMDMSQMDLPSDADIKKQVRELEEQGKQIIAAAKKQVVEASKNPQVMAQAQANPEQAQQAAQQIQQQAQQQIEGIQEQIKKLGETVTIDQVMKLLKEQRLRPFVLDIETDSTIAPDENAQKQRATEFVTAVGGFMRQAIEAVQMVPQAAPLMADTLKYVASQFRAGRELDASIDEFAEQMKAMGAQQKVDPAAEQAKAQLAEAAQKMQIEQERLKLEQADDARKAEQHQQDIQIKQAVAAKDVEIKGALADHEAQLLNKKYGEEIYSITLKREQDAQKHQAEMEKSALDIENKKLTNFSTAQSAVIDRAQAEQSAVNTERTTAAKLNGMKGNTESK